MTVIRSISEEMKARLAELDAAGHSATQIAKALGNEFGVYKTRNSIIGLIHRMGLRKTRESRANKPAPAFPVKKQSRHSGRPEGGRPLRPAPVKAPTTPVMGNPITPAPSGSVGLLDLEHHHCRAIVGRGTDGLATFCGASKSAGSYCAAHARGYFASTSSFREAAE